MGCPMARSCKEVASVRLRPRRFSRQHCNYLPHCIPPGGQRSRIGLKDPLVNYLSLDNSAGNGAPVTGEFIPEPVELVNKRIF